MSSSASSSSSSAEAGAGLHFRTVNQSGRIFCLSELVAAALRIIQADWAALLLACAAGRLLCARDGAEASQKSVLLVSTLITIMPSDNLQQQWLLLRRATSCDASPGTISRPEPRKREELLLKTNRPPKLVLLLNASHCWRC